MQSVLIVLSLVFSVGVAGNASAARLDKNGCYTKEKTGEYVCPHGNKAAMRAESPGSATRANRPTDISRFPKVARNDRATTMNDAGSAGCCKVCKTGKACGNGCIAQNKVCRKPTGCACTR